ncbi:hypothetical protein HDV63DRAFT_275560 [Trichoderma sp. SZMC 28014]
MTRDACVHISPTSGCCSCILLVLGRVEGDTCRAGMGTDRIPSEDGPWLGARRPCWWNHSGSRAGSRDAGNSAVEVQQRRCVAGHFPAAQHERHLHSLQQHRREERVWRSNQYFGSKGGVSARNPEAGPNKRFFAVMYAWICMRLHKPSGHCNVTRGSYPDAKAKGETTLPRYYEVGVGGISQRWKRKLACVWHG